MTSRVFSALLLVLAFAAGCVHPRRTTSLTPVTTTRDATGAPDGLWQLTIVSASIPPRQRGDRDWDDDGGLPDSFLRVYRNDTLVWESEPVSDSLEPRFDVTLPDNVSLPRSSAVRFELWDEDPGFSEPIGVWRGRGLPETALPGADARLSLDSRATLVVRVARPIPRRGTGIATYEVRGDAFKIIEVLPDSPASRAGLTRGDRILAIDGETIAALGDGPAGARLSSVGPNGGSLTIEREGAQVELELDGGYVWTAL